MAGMLLLLPVLPVLPMRLVRLLLLDLSHRMSSLFRTVPADGAEDASPHVRFSSDDR